MTNQFDFDDAQQFVDFNWLTQLSPIGLIFVFVMALCYFARRLKNIPTSWVWPITVIGVVFYLLIGHDIANVDAKQNMVFKFIYGTVASISGTVAAWGLHDKALVYLASKWSFFSFFVSDDLKPSNNQNP